MLLTHSFELDDYFLEAEFEFDPGTPDYIGPTPESSYVGDDFHFVLLSLYTTIAGHDVDLMDIDDIISQPFLDKAEQICVDEAFRQVREEYYA